MGVRPAQNKFSTHEVNAMIETTGSWKARWPFGLLLGGSAAVVAAGAVMLVMMVVLMGAWLWHDGIGLGDGRGHTSWPARTVT